MRRCDHPETVLAERLGLASRAMRQAVREMRDGRAGRQVRLQLGGVWMRMEAACDERELRVLADDAIVGCAWLRTDMEAHISPAWILALRGYMELIDEAVRRLEDDR